MTIAALAQVSCDIAGTRSRKKKVALIATLLGSLDPASKTVAACYLAGALPQGRIGIGPSLVRTVRRGLEAPSADAAQQPTGPTLIEVDALFTRVKAIAGRGAVARRTKCLSELLAPLSDTTRDFLSNLLVGGLRQGALEPLVVEALAVSLSLPIPAVRRARMLTGSLVATVATALEGPDALAAVRITLFVPISPMLAKTGESIEAALDKLGDGPWVETKLDGARIQLHKDGERVAIYTRQLHDVTARLPELVALAATFAAEQCIVDGEAIAFDDAGKPYPFQAVMSRFGSRQPTARSLKLSARFFDILHVDGVDTLDQPFSCRRAELERVVGPLATDAAQALSADMVATRLEAAMLAGHEGLMLKANDGLYAAGRRGATWLKLKPFHTLDCVVLGVEPGSGRREGTLSNLHLGVRDGDGFAMVGKTFKGLSDALLAWQTERLTALTLEVVGYVHVVRPELVVEVAFDGVQDSPTYPCGLALRFARVRRYRPDKKASDADTLARLTELHESARSRRGVVDNAPLQ